MSDVKYKINEEYLGVLGFMKDVSINPDDRVYVWRNGVNGFDLLYVEELGLLTIERIFENVIDNYYILCKIQISSDSDLLYILNKLPAMKFLIKTKNNDKHSESKKAVYESLKMIASEFSFILQKYNIISGISTMFIDGKFTFLIDYDVIKNIE